MAVIRVVSRAGIALGATLLPTLAQAQYIGEAPPPLPAPPLGPESAANSLARNVRILAQSPRDYKALVGAGRAALATDDPEAAVGFFGRAADVWPTAAAPHAGLGAALVAMGEAARALSEFDQAQRLGASAASFAVDRGMARDLLGQQTLAQADYRLALTGVDAAEARRRLALSLAISGDRTGAMSALAPLLQRADVPTNRVRAFVLAIGGDADGAGRALDASVPGMSRRLDPFFRRLPTLTPAQKAAAVHLGVFPDSGAPNTALADASAAYAAPTRRSVAGTSGQTIVSNRLAGIDELLRQSGEPPARPATAAVPTVLPPRVQVATNSRVARPVPAVVAPAPRRIWVQLASGPDEGGLAAQFARLAAKQPDIFTNIRPYVSSASGKTKLLVGPFKSVDDSEIFVENLADAHIPGFSWTSAEGQLVRRLSTP